MERFKRSFQPLPTAKADASKRGRVSEASTGKDVAKASKQSDSKSEKIAEGTEEDDMASESADESSSDKDKWEKSPYADRQRRIDEERKNEWRQHNDSYAGWPPQPSMLEVDRIMDLIEPTLRDIFKIKVLAQAKNSTFAEVAPTIRFLTPELRAKQAIVKMYEERGEDSLSKYQRYALESARRAVEELKEMRESDRERREEGRG